MKGWLAGVMIFFSVNAMAQTGQNYKQQFAPSTKKEEVEQQKYYGTTEGKRQYYESHNYKNNFAKPGKDSVLIEECDGAFVYKSNSKNERGASSQTFECDLSGGRYIEQNYKRTFPGREK